MKVIQSGAIVVAMGLMVSVNSTLGGGLLLSLLALFGGILTGNDKLVDASVPFLIIFGCIWVAFIALTLVRNLRSL